MNYKSWLIEDLRGLDRLRFSIPQMETELETLESEYAAIRGTNFDKIPGGNSSQEDRLLTNMLFSSVQDLPEYMTLL